MPALVYVVSIAPALVVALVDWLIAKTPILTVVGTTLFAYGVAVLYLAWDGSARYIFALGMISGPFVASQDRAVHSALNLPGLPTHQNRIRP